ncbi:MAG: hypothetical protein U0892_08070 [Pirellulales bacterium]
MPTMWSSAWSVSIVATSGFHFHSCMHGTHPIATSGDRAQASGYNERACSVAHSYR